MTVSNRWLLPDGVDELLPPEAWSVEHMRRAMLDCYASFGYQLVTPPLIEFLDSLLTGTGNNLDLQTFKLTDQLTGRMMGVRADITPQAARIDSHLLKTDHVNRLCYVDTVLHTRPAHMLTNRSPMQIGCELFGESSAAADLEIVSLMLETLRLAGIEQVHVDLAHVGIYRGLIANAKLGKTLEAKVFDALSRKSIPELDQLAEASGDGRNIITIVRDFARLSGSTEALQALRDRVEQLGDCDAVLQAIDALQAFATQLAARFPSVDLGFDFCELRGYDYHTGVMFAAYTPGYGDALAKGGRYDDVGKDFGRSRPATGFSADLKYLARAAGKNGAGNNGGILAPAGDDAELLQKIAELRQTERVVQRLSENDSGTSGCDRQLVKENNVWHVRPL
ncbi:MAG: ATP phosphoribosyltransferase regulatory subunit [Oleiphilaceae bacterium]|nr:ATP phosphoribosyltransferase regulatory subunit [Oleiphilaceae bacterium]